MRVIDVIAQRAARLRGLLRRYRVDRRLPPTVAELYRATLLLQFRDRIARAVGLLRPVLASSATRSRSSSTAWYGSRRITTAQPLAMSLFEAGHENATAVSDRLAESEVDHFVVDRRGDGLEFGVAVRDRERAVAALQELAGPGWYLRWADGRAEGIEALHSASSSRRVKWAREWTIFRAYEWGDRAVGAEQGTAIGFWETGTSGLLEKIGVRDQDRFDARSPHTVEMVDGRPYRGRTAFPVGANLEHVVDPIDIVYTWVDGSDPVWQTDFKRTAEEAGRSIDEEALDPARYHSRDELRYSLRSVWANCGWVRTIWIVTAGQRPEWLREDPRVRVVDHREILPASALPTFNSHAIEAGLHHIDGLAEQFVYFNDDVFIGRSMRPERFFTPNGMPRVFQSAARPPGFEDAHTEAVDTAARRGRELLAEHFGRVATTKPHHSPHPLSRSVMADLEQRFADVVTATQHSRFRSVDDLSIAGSFTQHYALATGRAVFGQIDVDYVNVESARLHRHLDRIRLDPTIDTYCINETRRDGDEHDDRERRISEFFEHVLPIPAPWER